MVDVKSLPEDIGQYRRKSPTSNAWIKGNIIALVHEHYVCFGTAVPVGAFIKKVEVESNEDVIREIKKGYKKD